MKMLNLKDRNPGTKFPGNLGYHEKTNLREIRREKGNPGQKHGKLFKQNYRRKIPPNKEVSIKGQEAYKTPNRNRKKIPMTHNNLNTEHRKNIKSFKRKRPSHILKALSLKQYLSF